MEEERHPIQARFGAENRVPETGGPWLEGISDAEVAQPTVKPPSFDQPAGMTAVLFEKGRVDGEVVPNEGEVGGSHDEGDVRHAGAHERLEDEVG
jgi:hypothetical protein